MSIKKGGTFWKYFAYIINTTLDFFWIPKSPEVIKPIEDNFSTAMFMCTKNDVTLFYWIRKLIWILNHKNYFKR